MLLKDFLLHQTQVGELCVVRDAGWVYAAAYIDHEDLFAIPERLAEREVRDDAWGELRVTTEHGDRIAVPCHYVDV